MASGGAANTGARLDALRARAAHLLSAHDAPAELHAQVHEFSLVLAELEVQAQDLERSRVHGEQSRRQYFELFELVPVAVLWLDPLQVVLDVNSPGAALLQRTTEQLRRTSFTRLVDGDGQQAFTRLGHDARAGVASTELSLKQPGGGRLAVQALLKLRDDGTFLLALQDQSSRRQLEAALAAATAREHALLEHLGDPALVLDTGTHRVTAANHRACALLQLRAASLIGRPRDELFSAAGLLLGTLTLDGLSRSPGSGTTPLTLRSASGTDVPVDASCEPLLDKQVLLRLRPR